MASSMDFNHHVLGFDNCFRSNDPVEVSMPDAAEFVEFLLVSDYDLPLGPFDLFVKDSVLELFENGAVCGEQPRSVEMSFGEELVFDGDDYFFIDEKVVVVGDDALDYFSTEFGSDSCSDNESVESDVESEGLPDLESVIENQADLTRFDGTQFTVDHATSILRNLIIDVIPRREEIARRVVSYANDFTSGRMTLVLTDKNGHAEFGREISGCSCHETYFEVYDESLSLRKLVYPKPVSVGFADGFLVRCDNCVLPSYMCMWGRVDFIQCPYHDMLEIISGEEEGWGPEHTLRVKKCLSGHYRCLCADRTTFSHEGCMLFRIPNLMDASCTYCWLRRILAENRLMCYQKSMIQREMAYHEPMHAVWERCVPSLFESAKRVLKATTFVGDVFALGMPKPLLRKVLEGNLDVKVNSSASCWRGGVGLPSDRFLNGDFKRGDVAPLAVTTSQGRRLGEAELDYLSSGSTMS